MQYNQKTHKQFIEELFVKNEFYRNGDFIIKSEYTTCKDKLLLGTRYGDVKVRVDHLLNNLSFSIESAVDKNDFARRKIIEFHGDIFDLTKLEYTRARDNIVIGCKKHGFVEVQFNNLMQYRGCPKCGRESQKEEGKSNGGWEYSRWEKQASNSLFFDSFKVYTIKCFNENEEFYKIGKTFNTLDNRFKGKNTNKTMPYKWEVVKIYEFNTGFEASDFESKAKRICKEYRYTPQIYFKGMWECFSKLI